MIVARSENGVIGVENRLPWHLPADLQQFKRLTTGHTIIMGRRTHESIGRVLPHRRSIVLTRNRAFTANGVDVAHSPDQALAMTKDESEVFVIGGDALFRWFLPRADRIYLTIVHTEVTGDVFFPELDPERWHVVAESHHEADERHAYGMTFRVLDRSVPSTQSAQ